MRPTWLQTPERISIKLGISYITTSCVVGMTTLANPCDAATTWVVSANTWFVGFVACFGFLYT